jgi:hypothetical protein
MPGIDTSMYAPPAQPQVNMLGMIGDFARTQNALNQNQLFEQTFAARKAIGPIMQQAVNPDGSIDYNRAAVMLSTHPDAAFLAPDIINGWIAREKTQADTVLTNLDIANKRAASLGGIAGGLVDSGHSGRSFKDPQGNPVSDAISREDLVGAVKTAGDLHQISHDDQIAFLSNMGVDPKTGKYDPRLGYQHLLRFTQAQQGAEKTLGSTFDAVSTAQGGVTSRGTVSKTQGTYTPLQGAPVPGGQFPELPTASERNAPVTTTNPVTGAQSQTSRAAMPMQTGAGTPAPGTGGTTAAPAAPAPGAPTSTIPEPGQPVPGTAAWMNKLGPVQEEALKGMGPYIQSVNRLGTTALTVNQIMDEMDKARTAMKTGGGAELFAHIGQIAQAFGINNATVDKISNGSLPDAQEYNKLSLQLGVAMLKQGLMGAAGEGGPGRILQVEYQNYQDKNPNIESDPRTVDKMFQFIRKQNSIAMARMHSLSILYGKANSGQPLPDGMSDLSQFENWYNNMLVKRGQVSAGAIGKGAP